MRRKCLPVARLLTQGNFSGIAEATPEGAVRERKRPNPSVFTRSNASALFPVQGATHACLGRLSDRQGLVLKGADSERESG